MKLDLSPEAIDRRLQQAAQLRRLYLSLAQASIGRDLARSLPHHPVIQRTSRALGRATPES